MPETIGNQGVFRLFVEINKYPLGKTGYLSYFPIAFFVYAMYFYKYKRNNRSHFRKEAFLL